MNALWKASSEDAGAEAGTSSLRPQPDPNAAFRGYGDGPAAVLNADSDLASSEGPEFSPLELSDRVVIMLLFDQVVREDQVHLAWYLWHQMGTEGVKEPLWRVLTLFPELDREVVYAEAARVYGFEEAQIARPKANTLITALEGRLDPATWNQLVDLRVLPVAEIEEGQGGRERIVFATPDPTRVDIHRLMPRLHVGNFELRYAPEHEIINLLVETFPHRYTHLKTLSGVTQDLLSGEGLVKPGETGGATEEGDDQPQYSIVRHFEDVLEEAVAAGATDVCFLPTPEGYVEVYYQIDEVLERRRVLESVDADVFTATIRRDVMQVEACGDGRIQKQHIQRWMGTALRRFRVSVVPSSEDVQTECIVVHVLA